MQTLNRFLILSIFLFYCAIPLSIGQKFIDSTAQTIELMNTSFEQLENKNETVAKDWGSCNFEEATPTDIQPGRFGCQLLPQQGKQYLGMVGRDDGTFEAIRQVLKTPLKAGICYKMSVYLAKSSKYECLNKATGREANYIRPLKLVIWGASTKLENNCKIVDEDWLTESLAIHNDNWRKYTFYIQPPKDINTLILSAAHVVEKPYNGNLLIDNISAIVPVNCTDLRQMQNSHRIVKLELDAVSEVIKDNAPSMVFGKKMTKLKANTEGGRNKAFDQILSYFEKTNNYKLIIHVKKGKALTKERIAFLYSYIFKNTNLKAQRVEIKPFTPKDEAFFWTFENDEIAVSFDSM